MIFSYVQPRVISPTTWNDQINDPEDVEPPRAERFQEFDPQDIVYIEGEVTFIERDLEGEQNYIKIEISDDSNSCTFSHHNDFNNFSDIHVHDHVFLEIRIVEVESVDDGFILSGNDPTYFGEKAVLVDIKKDYFSLKPILLFVGIVIIVLGLIMLIYLFMIKGVVKGNDK